MTFPGLGGTNGSFGKKQVNTTSFTTPATRTSTPATTNAPSFSAAQATDAFVRSSVIPSFPKLNVRDQVADVSQLSLKDAKAQLSDGTNKRIEALGQFSD